MRRAHAFGRVSAFALVVALAGCTSNPGTSNLGAAETPSVEPSVSPVASPTPTEEAPAFPTEAFADISEDPVSRKVAAEFQAALNDMAGDGGMAATVMTPDARGAEPRARPTPFETSGSTISSRSPASRSRSSPPK